MFQERIDRLLGEIQLTDIHALALNAGPDLFYFTGLHFHLSERPVVLLITINKPPALIFPEFESEKVQSAVISLKQFPYDEDRSKWSASFSMACHFLDLTDKKIGVNPISFRFLEMDLLKESTPESKFVSAANVLAQLKQKKDENEFENITKAIDIAQQALNNTIPFISIGKTEKEIANELAIQLLKAGSDPELPFMPIVAAGLNSANPHAIPTNRRIMAGNLLLIDWGACFNGYASDLTRTFSMESISDDFFNVAQVVINANEAARNFHQKQMTSHHIDLAARSVIEKAGYGKFFTHRTGHGIGLEAHEEPYIQSDNHTILENGMAFTIEPGIYLPGKGGIRIEDNVIVEDGHLKTITTFPRELKILYK